MGDHSGWLGLLGCGGWEQGQEAAAAVQMGHDGGQGEGAVMEVDRLLSKP